VRDLTFLQRSGFTCRLHNDIFYSLIGGCQVSEERFASVFKVEMLGVLFFWDMTLRQSAFKY
jgi:hypothetical protein